MQRIIARGYILSTKNIRFAGISPAKRSRSGQNSVYLDMWRGDNVQEILGAIDPCWPKWGLRRVLADCEFIFCGNPRDFSETSQQPIFTKFSHETSFGVPSRNPERHFRKLSTLWVIYPKIWNRKSVKQTSLRAGYRLRDALQRDTV